MYLLFRYSRPHHQWMMVLETHMGAIAMGEKKKNWKRGAKKADQKPKKASGSKTVPRWHSQLSARAQTQGYRMGANGKPITLTETRNQRKTA
jgi:hypothetical protein